ncbi:acetate--CoA ligase family protein [Hydrogenophaga sp.]|uniref:acetate--CoA ligase family protein n=1 Tax=Hydrogenophaga sp. TaxID=1904254 RepID=UPI00271B11D6|nr:acetate--CoA ligase family protein [Hydrogenophaga sp.]MDO9435955.1 acetate--CoA ligase family protein [Hydrogenophaga sp.]
MTDLQNDAFRRTEGLQRLVAPRSIAIIGASNDPTRIGGRPLARLIETGYTGDIYPVNPRRESVQGIAALASPLDLPLGVDCAVVAVSPAEAVMAVRECAQRGVGSIVLFSAGFAEAGVDGTRLQNELEAISRDTGIRVLGPNCMGVFNVAQKAHMSFGAWAPTSLSERFNVAIISQSGGYGSHVLRMCQRRGLGVSHWMTTGNGCDVQAGELIEAVAADPNVSAVFVYIEGVRSGASLVAGLKAARRYRKPVVVVKCGKSELGAAAAASHTAALAGSDAVYDAVLREHGALRADSTEEAMDVLYALSAGVMLAEPRTAVFTLSGGVGVQIADYMGANGIDLPELSAGAQASIYAMVPGASARNPVDITAQFMNETALVRKCLDLVMDAENFDVVLSFLSTVGLLPDMVEPIIEAYGDAMHLSPGRLNIVAIIATPDIVAKFERAGCLVFEEPKRAVAAIAAVRFFARAFAAPERGTLPSPCDAGLRIERGARFNEIEAKQLAQRCGIRIPVERVVRNAEEACKAAEAMGYPVALKVVSADILHKTEVGGVRLGLQDSQTLAGAVEDMARSVAQLAPHAAIDGFVVSEMVTGGVECALGVTHDAVFGPVVMFGIGGTLVELVRDVAFRLAPINIQQAHEMIAETQTARLLAGYRGAPPADVQALATAIVSVSEFAVANADTLKTLEINPLRVLDVGCGVLALDAVVETLTE